MAWHFSGSGYAEPPVSASIAFSQKTLHLHPLFSSTFSKYISFFDSEGPLALVFSLCLFLQLWQLLLVTVSSSKIQGLLVHPSECAATGRPQTDCLWWNLACSSCSAAPGSRSRRWMSGLFPLRTHCSVLMMSHPHPQKCAFKVFWNFSSS